MSGDLPDDEVGLYPCIDGSLYEAHIFPRVVLARELVHASDEVREAVFHHGWSDLVSVDVTIPLHNHPRAQAERQYRAEHAPYASMPRHHVRVCAARTELGWLVWAAGNKFHPSRCVAFETLGHLVQALADDPYGYHLLPLVEALVASRLSSEQWTLLKVQAMHWCHQCDETVPAYTCTRHWIADRQRRRLSARLSARLRLPTMRRKPRREDQAVTLPDVIDDNCTSCHTNVQVPPGLYEMGGLSGRDLFWVETPSRGLLTITSSNKPLSEETLSTMSYDRAFGELNAWEEALQGVCPDVWVRGGLPDGWHHVSQLAAHEGTTLHLVRSSSGWVIVGRRVGRPRHPVDLWMVTAAHTMGHLACRYTTWVGSLAGWEDAGAHALALRALSTMCQELTRILPAEEATTEDFLSALAGRPPAVAFTHRVTLDDMTRAAREVPTR